MKSLENELMKLQHLRLSDEDSSRMRAELSAYADLHAVRPVDAKPIPSPFSSIFSTTFPRFRAASAAALMLIISLGGTAYASESSLPGDVLYPVKINLTERVQTALIPTTKGKAAWHAVLAERRLEEAALLAATGALSTTTQQTLAANFNAQVDASIHDADTLALQGDVGSSFDVRSDLEARITAHEHILGIVIGAAVASTTDTALAMRDIGDDHALDTPAHAFLKLIQERQREVTSARIAYEDAAVSPAAGSARNLDTSSESVAHTKRAEVARSEEIQSILAKHATLLAAFEPHASSTDSDATATSTATSTASTTEDGTSSHEGEDGEHEVNINSIGQ